MARTDQHFELYEGDDKILTCTIYDEDGVVLDLTGLEAAQWVLKKYPTSDTASISKTLGSGITNSAPTTGVLSITLTAVNTEGMTPGEYYHELRIRNSVSKTGVVLTGIVTILPADSI